MCAYSGIFAAKRNRFCWRDLQCCQQSLHILQTQRALWIADGSDWMENIEWNAEDNLVCPFGKQNGKVFGEHSILVDEDCPSWSAEVMPVHLLFGEFIAALLKLWYDWNTIIAPRSWYMILLKVVARMNAYSSCDCADNLIANDASSTNYVVSSFINWHKAYTRTATNFSPKSKVTRQSTHEIQNELILGRCRWLSARDANNANGCKFNSMQSSFRR